MLQFDGMHPADLCLCLVITINDNDDDDSVIVFLINFFLGIWMTVMAGPMNYNRLR